MRRFADDVLYALFCLASAGCATSSAELAKPAVRSSETSLAPAADQSARKTAADRTTARLHGEQPPKAQPHKAQPRKITLAQHEGSAQGTESIQGGKPAQGKGQTRGSKLIPASGLAALDEPAAPSESIGASEAIVASETIAPGEATSDTESIAPSEPASAGEPTPPGEPTAPSEPAPDSESTPGNQPAPEAEPAMPEVEPDGKPDAAAIDAADRGTAIETHFDIDLPTAMRLADSENPIVNQAREQIALAYAELKQAHVLWLPSLRAGAHVNKHAGPLQNTDGSVVNIDRMSLYAGSGGFAVGSGSPAIPGIFANFQVADAIFQPLAAQQRVGARKEGAVAQRNDTLLAVSLAYLELLRALQDVAIANELYDKMHLLSEVTESYAKSGQGLQADADRLRVEAGLRKNDIRRTEEVVITASARLAQLLRLDPCFQLDPLEPTVVPLDLVPEETDCAQLVVRGLTSRPELKQAQFLVGEAVMRLKREKYAPLVPSVWLGTSLGGFGAGNGTSVSSVNGRVDFDLSLYWEVRNLGFGEAAARENAGARMRVAQLQQIATLDQVAREVTEANAQVQFRRRQIETARKVVSDAIDSYERNVLRIRQGQGLPIEALQSTLALLQARREYLRTVIDFNGAQFTLLRALGWPTTI
jgi:outer membrane protein TolC